MNRATADKLESNVNLIKNELDNYYLGNPHTIEAIASLAARICELANGHKDRLTAADTAERLLLDLTPGGSEFHGSPERCAQWAKDSISFTGKLAAQRNRLRTAAAALAVAVPHLLAALDSNKEPLLYNQREAKELVREALREYREVK